MITNLIMAILISAAGVSTNLVYNVKMENNRLANKEVFSVENGKYLKRLFKMDFTYNALQCARTGDRQENLRVERRPPKLHPSTDGNLQSDRRQTG